MWARVTLKPLARRSASSLSYTPPSMVDLPSRWSTMNPQLQEEITEYLTWKMEDSWKLMTVDELKASYYISYGQWGPRGKTDIQLTPTMLIWKGLFSTLLFTALGVSLINLKRDKHMDKALNGLQRNSSE
ncbi:hypothetical protein ZYGR_0P03680 [Zygosaccharomyces rouxii]|uniref:ZYRO0E08976p n=2 Tax=Zygosaccharomyces rouxii TaxID=4956 RepID=C5E4V1_ZYGRC|nr:uncharacterized protein ZYRO0E08976g [Zygosaccharomyces rouxii]KAH9198082.1 hypothetical protein LQ764DRAFT_146341 [Zygosaccharomyces rouxii]GAV49722.1 hypothetical protein ZYGR_0P03680 [Zygosaccharomyces rouxii]CAR31062.1 ZYRO0E08976p [Zygosaccharomyces rouxii]